MFLDSHVTLFILTAAFSNALRSKNMDKFDSDNVVSQWPVWNRWPARTEAFNETIVVSEAEVSYAPFATESCSPQSDTYNNYSSYPAVEEPKDEIDVTPQIDIMMIESNEVHLPSPLGEKAVNETLTTTCPISQAGVVSGARIPSNSTRVVGGNSVSINQYPFMAQIITLKKNGRGVFCGGALISHHHVLTAGHCVTLPTGLLAKPKTIQVRLGATKLAEGGEVYVVSKIHRHPKYHPLSSRQNGASVYDLGVLKLKKNVKFSNNVSPVALATNFDTDKLLKMAYMNWPCKVLGWGWTKPGIKLDSPGADTTLSRTLMMTTVHLVDWTECRTIVPILENESELCCASPHTTSGCKGDSGGPLVCEDNKEYGLVSRGTGAGCGIPNLPYIYTRIDTLHKFIEQAMKG